MDKPLSLIPEDGKRAKLKGRLNDLGSGVRSSRPGRVPGMMRKWGPNGFRYLRIEDEVEAASSVKRLKITSIKQNYIGCRAFGADALTPEIWVAKQGNAVGDAEGGTSNPNKKTTHLQNPTVDLVQDLVPPYVVGGTIYAAMDVVDGTAMNTAVAPIEEIKHLEISPVREWVDPLQVFCVRVNNVELRSHVRGTPPA
jgi:hypothetical protein